MDFGQPNVEIGRKLANGQLLFLALVSRFHKRRRNSLGRPLIVDIDINTAGTHCPVSMTMARFNRKHAAIL